MSIVPILSITGVRQITVDRLLVSEGRKIGPGGKLPLAHGAPKNVARLSVSFFKNG